jgi:hypothetical protein
MSSTLAVVRALCDANTAALHAHSLSSAHQRTLPNVGSDDYYYYDESEQFTRFAIDRGFGALNNGQRIERMRRRRRFRFSCRVVVATDQYNASAAAIESSGHGHYSEHPGAARTSC